MSPKNQPLQFSAIIFKASLLVIVFVVGGFFSSKNYPPFQVLKQGYKDTVTLFKEMNQVRPSMLRAKVYKGEGVTIHDPKQSSKGLTILQGIFSDGLQVKLIDMDGTILHAWPLDFYKIWPNPSHLTKEKLPKSSFNYHSQGILALPDGSIIVNFGYLGTAKLDKCGKTLWTVDRMTRHFVSPTADGNYWIGANREIDDIDEELLFFDINRSWLKGTLQRYENTMLLVSSDGKVLNEVSILQAFFDAGFEGHIFDAFQIAKDDLTHNNDVGEVTQALADKIEGVNEGDLLLSIRNMNMLVILDKESYAIKWTYSGSWTRQHDADITPEGNIIVFDNSGKSYGFNRVKGSTLTELVQASLKTRIVHPQNGQPSFYTEILGTHQALPNSNILISEGLAGRVFEINKQGDIVWEFVSSYDDTHASAVEAVYRYDPSYFNVKDWSCDSATQKN